MLELQTFSLTHVHDGERYVMEEQHHHDAAEHDPEQGWRAGMRIFRCTSCAEEVVVSPSGHDTPDPDPA
jgi:hypothetical protein